MAASCGPSITQFAMNSMQCDQNDDKRSVQDVNVSDANVLMMLTAVSMKRAGTTIECPVAPSIIFLAPRRLLVYSQQDTPGFLFLQTLSVFLYRLYTGHPHPHLERHQRADLCKTVRCRHVFCLNNGLLSDLRITIIGLMLGAVIRSIPASFYSVISHYVGTHAKEIEESRLTRQADTTRLLVCLSEVHSDLRVHIQVPR
jgi:hypothetical protein